MAPGVRLRARERKTESWQRERRGKSESRWWWRIDRWFVNLRGFDRSQSPPPLPPLVFPHIVRERECEFLPGAHGYNLLLSRGYGGLGEPAAHPEGFHSQVVVSSLPPCSLSLLRRGAETGAVPGAEPCALLARENGALSA